MERKEEKMNGRNKAQERERKRDKEKRKKMRGSNQEKRGSLYEEERRKKKVKGEEEREVALKAGWQGRYRQAARQTDKQADRLVVGQCRRK